MNLEEFVHLLKHLFDALADSVALFVEGDDGGLGFGGEEGLELELFAKVGGFGLGFGAGFALLLDDLYGTEDFLL